VADRRVELLAPEAARAAAEGAGVPAAFAALHVFRALLHRPHVAKGLADLLVSLLFRGALDARLRELVILRIGWATASDYEWTQHWSIAQERFGVSAEDCLAVRDWRGSERFGEAERAVLAATDETLETGTLSAATWARCREHLARDEAIELVAAIGCWRLVSQLTRSLEIPLEEGVASWPPDGRAPQGA
jgi:alkylhydroperoxidase family enzyme